MRLLANQCSEVGVVVVVDGGLDGVAFGVIKLGRDWHEGVVCADAHAGEDAFKFLMGDDDAVFEGGEGVVVFAV